MIRAEGVTKIFGSTPEEVVPLLEQGKSKDDIQQETGHIVGVSQASFELAAGETFVIMGLSGSGKSTLLRCINRLVEPTSGRIFFDPPDSESIEITGADEEGLRDIRTHRVSMVFQHFALFPHRTVLSNIAYGLEVQGYKRAERLASARESLEMVGLGSWGDAYPSELSGGMQQRVGLARALATQAQVLLMDEPFSALDPLIKVNMQDELLKIQEQLGRTIIFITHDLDEAMRIGDRIAIMDGGVIVQIGTPEEILVNPKTEYVANFVEHADATGVLTAKTIALPLQSNHFSQVGQQGSLEYYSRATHPHVRYGVDSHGKLAEMLVDDIPVTLAPLAEVITAEVASTRRKDLALLAPESTVLRQVLQGRRHSTLPTIVVSEDTQQFVGIVDELELIGGILEKRGASEAPHAAEPTDIQADEDMPVGTVAR